MFKKTMQLLAIAGHGHGRGWPWPTLPKPRSFGFGFGFGCVSHRRRRNAGDLGPPTMLTQLKKKPNLKLPSLGRVGNGVRFTKWPWYLVRKIVPVVFNFVILFELIILKPMSSLYDWANANCTRCFNLAIFFKSKIKGLGLDSPSFHFSLHLDSSDQPDSLAPQPIVAWFSASLKSVCHSPYVGGTWAL